MNAVWEDDFWYFTSKVIFLLYHKKWFFILHSKNDFSFLHYKNDFLILKITIIFSNWIWKIIFHLTKQKSFFYLHMKNHMLIKSFTHVPPWFWHQSFSSKWPLLIVHPGKKNGFLKTNNPTERFQKHLAFFFWGPPISSFEVFFFQTCATKKWLSFALKITI